MQETQHTQQTTNRTARNQDKETTWICKSIEKYTEELQINVHEHTLIKGNMGVLPWNGQGQKSHWIFKPGLRECSTSPLSHH